MSTFDETWRRVVQEPKVAPRTVRAHPDQPLNDGSFAFAWAQDWTLGRRKGRWAVRWNRRIGASWWVRVEWSRRAPLLAAWQFDALLDQAAHDLPDEEIAGLQEAAQTKIAAFDAMAVRLWKQEHR
jgi:hypothetical protein